MEKIVKQDLQRIYNGLDVYEKNQSKIASAS